MSEFYHVYKPAWAAGPLCILCHAPYVPAATLCPGPACTARRLAPQLP